MPLDTISSSQSGKEITANSDFEAVGYVRTGGRRASTCSGLTWGYYGGNVDNAGTITPVVDGTLSLADNTTNYIEMTAAGVVSSNTSAFTAGRTQLYTAVTASGLVTSYTDKRAPGSGSGGGTTPTGTGFVHITSGAQDGTARAVDVSSADVTGVLAGARFPALTGDVTTSSGAVATTWHGGTANASINGAPTVTIASASTVNIGAAAGNYISITGIVTITAFDTIAAGAERAVAFTGILVLTHNGTSLILPSAANITTAAGDSARFVSLGGGNWKCIAYQRADGTALAASGSTFTGGTLTSALNEAPRTTLSSAGTVNIGAAGTNSVTISGTVTITAFDTIADGAIRHITFSGALTLTHNATSLILPGAANLTTATGDCADFQSLGSGNWRCIDYTRAAGTAVIASGVSTATADFGNGADSSAHLDGSNTVTWASKSGSVYTMTRPCALTSLTIDGGVTLKPALFPMYINGTLTNNGTIDGTGANATNATAGSGISAGFYGANAAGGAVSAGSGGGANPGIGAAGGAGGNATGAGGTGGGGTAGAVTLPLATNGGASFASTRFGAIMGRSPNGTQYVGGAGGGGGTSGTATAGAGGAGGQIIGIFAAALAGNGTITAAGGNGANASAAGNAGGGGGGGGGYVWVLTHDTSWYPTMTVSVSGGNGGTPLGTGNNGATGSTGTFNNYVV